MLKNLNYAEKNPLQNISYGHSSIGHHNNERKIYHNKDYLPGRITVNLNHPNSPAKQFNLSPYNRSKNIYASK